MIPVSSLLNPPMESQLAPSSSTARSTLEPLSQTPSTTARPPTNNNNATITVIGNSSRGYLRSRTKGNVNFPPFEDLDEESLAKVLAFIVFPLGRIMETARRIPYNSSKKDFYQKTGRESFDVVHYEFTRTVRDVKSTFTVMWDYNVGLVRMTPFFKCLEYSKTTPAKMLNQNAGLKDITYSITGGSIKAQGYWMPYDCAKAVCATFCNQIAGALIPLFGPDFPSICVPEHAPGFRHMVIDQAIIAQAKRQAAQICQFPRTHTNGLLPSPTPSRTLSPMPFQRPLKFVPDSYDYRRQEYEKQMPLSPYGHDSDFDYHRSPPPSELYGRNMFDNLPPIRRSVMVPPSVTSRPLPPSTRGWTAVNHQQSHRSYRDHMLEIVSKPWLTALPRSEPPFGQVRRTPPPLPSHRTPLPSMMQTPILPPIRDYYPGKCGSLFNTNPGAFPKQSFDHQITSAGVNTASKRPFDQMDSSNGKRSFDRTERIPSVIAAGAGNTQHSRTPTPPSASHPSPSYSPSSSPSSSAGLSSASSCSPSLAFSSTSSLSTGKHKDKATKQREKNEEDAARVLIQLKGGDTQEEEGKAQEKTGDVVVTKRTPLPNSRDPDRQEREVKRVRRLV